MAMNFASESSLICTEDCSIVDGFEEEELNRHEPIFFFNNDASSCIADEDRLASLIAKEEYFMAREDYLARLHSGTLDVSARNDSIDWIYKVSGYYNFQPLTAYLSINFLDRFLSEYELPSGKAWTLQLLCVSCVSLAAKMEETDVPSALDLQVGEAKLFDARTIKRMELLLLATLKWRTNAVTPFSFIDCYLNRIKPENPHTKSLFTQMGELILVTTRVIEFLSFRPSEIALALVITMTGVDFCTGVDTCSSHSNRERTRECYELLQEISVMKQWWDFRGRVPMSPVGVLDAAACLSNDSNKTEDGSSSCSDSEHGSKRRRLQ